MSHPFDFDLAVIGAGAAGLSVAAGASRLGVKTLLAEKEPQLGGDCLHYGCVPSKTLIATARARHLLRTCSRFGLPEVPSKSVEFPRVRERIRAVIADIARHDSPERFRGLGVTVAFGQASFRDEHTLCVGDKTYSARLFCIATGSSPAIPDIAGLSPEMCLTNRDLFSLDALPASLCILGAGAVAMEMAQAFRRLGTSVTVVQRGGQILSREDKDMADLAMQAVLDEARADDQAGLDILLHAKVLEIRGSVGGIETVVQIGEEGPRTIRSERLLAALGRTPNTETLDLDKAGVRCNAKGLIVDERLRTSQKHIFAAGDITGAHQFTHAAGYEAGIVIANAVFRLPRKADYRLLPSCVFLEPELAAIGMGEKEAQAAGVAYQVFTESFADNDRARAENETVGKLKLLVGPNGKPIGARMLGPNAGECINEWVAVLGGKVKLKTLASLVHPYPTLGEINKRAAAATVAGALFSDRVRKVLRFLFGYKGSDFAR